MMKRVLFAGLLAACQEPSSPAPDPKAPSDSISKTASRAEGQGPSEQQVQEAKAAIGALASNLMGTLKSAVGQGDFEAGIQACKVAAPSLTRQVGDERTLEIGRTSFRLRNPANAPRDWAAPHVEARVEEAVVERTEDGTLRYLSPIRMKAPCLKCHGGPEDIPDAVSAKLAKLYPKDQATGFQEGALRGYFWVEVPPPGSGAAE